MKNLSFVGVAFATLLSAQAFAQEKKPLGFDDIAGKTFYSITRFGTIVYHYLPDKTFRACGNIQAGCDEGTWDITESGVMPRVFKTWMTEHNGKPPPGKPFQIGQNYTFGPVGASSTSTWKLLTENEKLPPGVRVDPRKDPNK